MITLDQLRPGQSAQVKKIDGKGSVRRRMMDMGIVTGVPIQVVREAPLGDPVDYLVRGYHLLLRKSEARMIQVTL